MNERTARGRYTLANDGEGTPIDVPAEAVAAAGDASGAE